MASLALILALLWAGSVKAPPCGAIAGRVVNARGEPMAWVEVTALRHDTEAWTAVTSYTDALGEFRIANLTAGRYFVRAAAMAIRGSRHPSVFYPSALTPEDAAAVPVLSGDTTPANFALAPGPAFRVSGRIEGYRADRAVCFGLVPAGYSASTTNVIGRISQFGADGAFAIDDVPPGSYVLSAATCGDVAPMSAIAPVDVDGDVDGLQVDLVPGGRLAGVVRGEGVEVAGLKLTLRSPDLSEVYVSRAVASGDGSFVFKHVLVRRHVVEISPMPAGAYVKSVRWDGGLEIVLSASGAAELRGSVVNRQGRPAAHAMVLLLPVDGPPESAKDVMADDQGNFAVSALRPGTYQAVAWECRMDPLAIATAALVFERTARTVTVSADGPGSVVLMVNTMADLHRARVAAGIRAARESW